MDKDNQFKLEITQDKLIDILMHAATREDIAKLDEKVDSKIDKLDSRIDKLDEKIESLRNDLKSDIRWVIGTIITVGLGIAGLMFTLLHK